MVSPNPTTVVASGNRSVSVGGDLIDSIVITGDNNTVRLDLGRLDGDLIEVLREKLTAPKRARSLPIASKPAVRPNHLDREREANELVSGIAPGTALNLYGAAGIGKTYLLCYAANHPAVARFPDGVAYLYGKDAPLDDLLEALFEQFYDYDRRQKPSDTEIRRDLSDKRALVFVDSFELEPDDAQQLLIAAPKCGFAVASRQRRVWDGTGMALGGFDVDDGVALVQRELGRSVVGAERAAAERLCVVLAGHPLELQKAAAQVRDEDKSLEEVLGAMAGTADPAAAISERTVASLSPEQRRVFATLAVFGTASVGTTHLAALTGVPEVQQLLDELEHAHLIRSSGSRYALAGVSSDEVEELGELRQEALEYFTDWAEAHRDKPEAQLEESSALLHLLRCAVRSGRSDEAMRLGRAINAAFALGRRWGAWREVLEAVREAATAAGDRAEQAWALHQLGTRDACLGHLEEGTALLQDARRIRKKIGDRRGVAATRHNLRAVGLLTGGGGPLRFFFRLPVLVALLALGGAALLWSSGTTTKAELVAAREGRGTGMVRSEPAGIECGHACRAEFSKGKTVTLVAIAQPGSIFAGWEGGPCSGLGPCTLTLDEARSVTAVFDPVVETRTMIVEIDGGGRGTVRSEPSGIDCGGMCRASFALGDTVMLTATAHDGSVFAGWKGACSGTPPCIVSLTDDRSVTAVFNAAPLSYPLMVAKRGTGEGLIRSTPSGIDCGAICDSSFGEGTSVVLAAIPAAGSKFAGWRGADCIAGPEINGRAAEVGTETCRLTMNGAQRVTALFDLIPVWELVVRKTPRSEGVVRSQPPGIDCEPTCKANFVEGTKVTLTAEAGRGWVFAGWKGGGCSGTAPCALVLSGNTEVAAAFQLVHQTLTVMTSKGGTVSIGDPQSRPPCRGTCTEKFQRDDEVRLTANPDQAYRFVRWEGACQGSGECTVMMSEDRQVRALFEEIFVE